MNGSITIIEPNQQSELGIVVMELIVDSLIANSGYVALLRPVKIDVVTDVPHIKKLVKSWLHWTSQPWIIAGRIDSSEYEVRYTGPYIKDCRDDGYNKQINKLLSEFDWALFSYFTTYYNERYNFVTSMPNLINLLDLKNISDPYRYKESYQSQFLSISCLRNATFYDYGKEGLYVYQLALERNEPLPFLLCLMLANEELYYRWDSEEEDNEEVIWYEEATKQLELIDEFEINAGIHPACYKIFRVNHLQAYLDIWKEASYNHSIVEATFSGDTDLSKLKMLISQNSNFWIENQIDEMGTWAYSQIYGGGADEHHAIFRSRNSEITHQLWQKIGEAQISRF